MRPQHRRQLLRLRKQRATAWDKLHEAILELYVAVVPMEKYGNPVITTKDITTALDDIKKQKRPLKKMSPFRNVALSNAALSTVVISALAGTPADAQIVDGQHLQQTCSSDQLEQQAACAGFISGTLDSTQRFHQFCIPPRISPKEVLGRTVDYLRGNARQIGGLPGDQQVTLALKAIWPCTHSEGLIAGLPAIRIPIPVPQQQLEPWVLPGCYFGGRRVPCQSAAQEIHPQCYYASRRWC